MKFFNYTLYNMLDCYKYIKLWQVLIIIIIIFGLMLAYRYKYYKDYIKREKKIMAIGKNENNHINECLRYEASPEYRINCDLRDNEDNIKRHIADIDRLETLIKLEALINQRKVLLFNKETLKD